MNWLSWQKSFLFWQPHIDWFKKISQSKLGRIFLIFINYVIWVYLFYISYLLIRQNANIFWQLFIATLAGEIIEKILKIKSFWYRPMHSKHNLIPDGLLKSWYQKGSFPSGHTIKVVYFLMFIIQYHFSINPVNFLSVTTPLILIRVFLGLHYPVDVLGGILIGLLIWYPIHFLIFPDFLVNFISIIFNFVFFIK